MGISNKDISSYLEKKGIMHSLIGYKYLMIGLRAMVDGQVDRYTMKPIYIKISSITGVSAIQIEKSIRNAIRKSDLPVSNKEFLTRALDDLLLSEDANAGLFKPQCP